MRIVLDNVYALVATVVVAFTFSAAQSPAGPASSGRVSVVASFYPLYEFTRRVGGDRVSVRTLVPAGVESHDYEPTPRDVVRLTQARVIVYSFTVGTWRVIVLNSVCWAVGGCGSQSPQAQWLRAELALAAQSTTCVAAITHHPPFSSGRHGPTFELRALWQILYEAGADLVLAGHDHLYERFAPQDSHGRLDLTRGIRQITVGTGGRSHYAFRGVAQNSEVRSTGTFGVLKLSLTSTAYAWQFVPVRGKTFADSGTTGCH